MPDVEFKRRPWFLLSGEDAEAHFRFRGHDFKVETIWADTHVCPEDDASAYPEIVEIQDHVEKHGRTPLGRWLAGLFKTRKESEDANTPSQPIAGKPGSG